MKSLTTFGFIFAIGFALHAGATDAESLFKRAMGATAIREQKKLVRELATKYPETPYGLFAQGMLIAMQARGNPNEEIAFYNRALEKKPDFVEALSNRGATKLQINDVAGALVDFNRAIEIKPDEATPYFNRGTVKAAHGDDAGALADFDKAISLKPTVAPFYYRRGLHKLRMDKPAAESCADFKAAVELGLETAATMAEDCSK
jgi:tetratricopeptide (TPR) repeat protein